VEGGGVVRVCMDVQQGEALRVLPEGISWRHTALRVRLFMDSRWMLNRKMRRSNGCRRCWLSVDTRRMGEQRRRRRQTSQHVGKPTDICFENQHANTGEALDGGG
jgi:hypothetical protein